jgi:hypothetical protein
MWGEPKSIHTKLSRAVVNFKNTPSAFTRWRHIVTPLQVIWLPIHTSTNMFFLRNILACKPPASLHLFESFYKGGHFKKHRLLQQIKVSHPEYYLAHACHVCLFLHLYKTNMEMWCQVIATCIIICSWIFSLHYHSKSL